MKVLFKSIAVVLTASIISACAGMQGPAVKAETPVSQATTSSFSTAPDPCKPYKADDLMAWATGVPNATMKHHERRAEVRVRYGRPDCMQSESASSAMSVQK